MSYLMDYGDDWPPAVVKKSLNTEAEHEPMTLAQRCGATVMIFAVLYAACALWLHFDPPIRNLTVTEQPVEGHATEVTTTLTPTIGDHR